MFAVEDQSSAWLSHGSVVFAFISAEARWFAGNRRRGGAGSWCPVLWVAKDVRRYAREHPPSA